jgi:hypothetical protein
MATVTLGRRLGLGGGATTFSGTGSASGGAGSGSGSGSTSSGSGSGHRLGLLLGRLGLGFDLFGGLLRLGLGYWLGFLLLEQNQLDRDDGIPGRLDEGRQAEGEQQDHGGVQRGRQHDALARRSQPGSDRALNLR